MKAKLYLAVLLMAMTSSACRQGFFTLEEEECVASTCEEAGLECGLLDDNCGEVLNCGDCVFPETCGASGQPGVCGVPPCIPSTCEELGYNCGDVADGCGHLLDCGNCTAPEICGGGNQPHICGGNCIPLNCEAQGAECGISSDGCGGTLDCGSCELGQICGGGGAPNQCGDATCTPLNCSQQNAQCGFVSDGCSNVLDCGACVAPEICGGGEFPNRCEVPTCIPLSCAQQGASCGHILDGCGGELDCGSCNYPETCGGDGQANTCSTAACIALTCAEQGAECGRVSDGCGAILDCGSCTYPETCGGGGQANLCGEAACLPLSCQDVALACGDLNDGCGGTLDCGQCTAGQLCGAGGLNRCGPQVRSSDGWKWQNPLPQGNALRDVWVASSQEAWAVGGGGTAMHYTNGVWARSETGTKNYLMGVWGDAPSNVWAVGASSTVLHWNGSSWNREMVTGEPTSFMGLTGFDDGSLVAVGIPFSPSESSVHLRSSAGIWSEMTGLPVPPPTCGGPLLQTDVWGVSADDFWVTSAAYCDDGTVVWHWDHGQWQEGLAVSGGGMSLDGDNAAAWNVWGSRPDDVWAVGNYGLLAHYDGTAWTNSMQPSFFNFYFGLSGSAPNDVWVVGLGGLIQHWNGQRWGASNGIRSDWLYDIDARHSDFVLAVGSGGTIQAYEKGYWSSMTQGSTLAIADLYASSAQNAWAVGQKGVILHWDGSAQRWEQAFTASGDLVDILGFADNDIWACGADGSLWRYQGVSWQRQAAPPNFNQGMDLIQMAGNGPGSMLLVGAGGHYVAEWDDDQWFDISSELDPTNEFQFRAVGADGGTGYWLAGVDGDLLHYDAQTNTRTDHSIGNVTYDFHAVSGSSANNMWAVGQGIIMRNNGSGWSTVTGLPFITDGSSNAFSIDKVWVAGDNDVWILTEMRLGECLCDGGPENHSGLYHWNGSTWTKEDTGAYTLLLNVSGIPGLGVWAVGAPGTILFKDTPN